MTTRFMGPMRAAAQGAITRAKAADPEWEAKKKAAKKKEKKK